MIYFIRSGEFVKIGVSARPWARLAESQTANPEPLEMLAIGPGDYGFEAELHKQFGEHRGVGEWFRDNERIRSVVVFMRDTFPELQSAPPVVEYRESRVNNVPLASELTEDDLEAGWRIERRYRTRKDGRRVMYWNYRRRNISHDEGQRRIEYRGGGSVFITGLGVTDGHLRPLVAVPQAADSGKEQ